MLKPDTAAHGITGKVLFMNLRSGSREFLLRGFLIGLRALFHDGTPLLRLLERYPEKLKSAIAA